MSTEMQSNSLPALRMDASRESALLRASEILLRSWRSFDTSREGQPIASTSTEELTRLPLPNDPEAIDAVLLSAEAILDESLAQARPRFFAFVGSSGLEAGVLGDMLAAAHDINLATTARAADLIEAQTVRWVGDLVGYPSGAGYFTSGGMISNLTALAAARERALPGAREFGFERGGSAIYASADAHASIRRAGEILGIGSQHVRAVPLDGNRRMDPDALKQYLAADEKLGVSPIAIVATAGTTLTGAVDPIADLADIAELRGIWLHVDGAYGLPAAASPRATALFEGLSRADSVSVDAHKWLFVPKACGCLMVRDPASLGAAFAHDSGYMLHDQERDRHPVDSTLEYSRPFRALKLWMALRTYGADAFRRAITRNLEQAQLLAELISAEESLELLMDPALSIVLFRHIAFSGNLNEHNTRLAAALQEDGRVWVSDAALNDMTCLRPCIVNYRTSDDDIRELVRVAVQIGGQLANR
jgi:aromatic-L-amino-acid decarboxylase